jgi:hypothetical protein
VQSNASRAAVDAWDELTRAVRGSGLLLRAGPMRWSSGWSGGPCGRSARLSPH